MRSAIRTTTSRHYHIAAFSFQFGKWGSMQDGARAAEYYERAVEQGYVDALEDLGILPRGRVPEVE